MDKRTSQIGRRGGVNTGGTSLAKARWVVRWACLVLCLVSGVFAIAQEGGAPVATTVSVPAHRQADNVAIIPITGEIGRVTSYSFQRRLAIAERSGADAIVIELDTPGGEVGAVLEITHAIRNASIDNTVAWVNPNAYSGGAIIALACKEIVTNRSIAMGDALPIGFDSAGQLMQLPEAERQKVTAPLLAEVVGSARLRGWDEYVVQGFVALGVELWWVRDPTTGETFAINENEYRMLFEGEPPRTRPILASAPSLSGGASDRSPGEQESGADGQGQDAPDGDQGDAGSGIPIRPEEAYRPASPALEGMPVESATIVADSTRRAISEADACKYELVGYLCTGDGPLTLNADELQFLGFASNLDTSGALVPIADEADLQAYFGAKNIRTVNASWSEALVVWATHPAVRGVLLVVFLLMLFLEMSAPGVGVPGAIALLALIGVLAPPALMGLANWWEIAAVIGGILFIFVEVFVLPGFGIPGIIGLLLLFGGMLGTFVGNEGLFPDSPQEQSNLLYGLVTMVLSAVSAGIGMYFISKHIATVPLLGRLVLRDDDEEGEGMLEAMSHTQEFIPEVGSTGRAITPLRPSGRMDLGDRTLDVVCEVGYVDAGAEVRVVAADEFKVVVEPVA